jgi:arylsulfatase A-like enzyme
MVLDACWEVLRAATSGDWQVNLLGLRGFPSGEHGRIGGVDGPLYAEKLHVPWLMRLPEGAGALARSGRLVSSLDLLPTIVDLLDGNGGAKVTLQSDGRSVLPLLRSARAPWRDALLFGSDSSDERAIRTAEWSLQYDDRTAGGRLFVRPDDRWEANEVAALCPDVVDGLIETALKTAARIRSGEPMPNES